LATLATCLCFCPPRREGAFDAAVTASAFAAARGAATRGEGKARTNCAGELAAGSNGGGGERASSIAAWFGSLLWGNFASGFSNPSYLLVAINVSDELLHVKRNYSIILLKRPICFLLTYVKFISLQSARRFLFVISKVFFYYVQRLI
jgi:hypothetical protein